MVEGSQEIQTSSYKTNHGDVMWSKAAIVSNTVLHTLKLLRSCKFPVTRKISVTMYSDGC